jgi:hypothetical protein
MRCRQKRRASPANISFLSRSLFVAIGLLSTLQASGEAAATSPGDEARWQAETVFQLTERSDHARTQGHLRRLGAVVGTTHLRFASPARPIIAGLMIEYQSIDGEDDTLLVGGMFTYKMPKWTASASPFYKRTAEHAAGDWHYWGGVRRRISSHHSLGIELFGALDTGKPAKWLLGYYGTITETLSVGVAVGSVFDAGPDWVARTSVTWRPRSDRR